MHSPPVISIDPTASCVSASHSGQSVIPFSNPAVGLRGRSCILPPCTRRVCHVVTVSFAFWASASRTARDPNNLSVHSVGAFGTNVAAFPPTFPQPNGLGIGSSLLASPIWVAAHAQTDGAAPCRESMSPISSLAHLKARPRRLVCITLLLVGRASLALALFLRTLFQQTLHRLLLLWEAIMWAAAIWQVVRLCFCTDQTTGSVDCEVISARRREPRTVRAWCGHGPIRACEHPVLPIDRKQLATTIASATLALAPKQPPASSKRS